MPGPSLPFEHALAKAIVDRVSQKNFEGAIDAASINFILFYFVHPAAMYVNVYIYIDHVVSRDVYTCTSAAP
jgi:hypothetical protein